MTRKQPITPYLKHLRETAETNISGETFDRMLAVIEAAQKAWDWTEIRCPTCDNGSSYGDCNCWDMLDAYDGVKKALAALKRHVEGE